jgi:ABC-type nitrate/sulfonate/bicarbonate transport system substrate-binding protein
MEFERMNKMKKNILVLLCMSIVFALTASGCVQKFVKQPKDNVPSSKGGKNLQKVTFVLDWTPNTNHTGIYAAKAKGFFEEEGLDVSIIQPGESSADQLVAANTAQFGISYQEGVTFARASGVPLVSIAAVIQHNTSGFGSLKSKGITSPKDFEGKKYGGWGSEVETAMVKQVVKDAGGDPDKVEILSTGTLDFLTASETNKIDFGWIFEGWDYINAANKGAEINYISLGKLSDVFDYYTPVIVTNEDNIAKNPELVHKFMRAAQKGYKFAIENADEAAECLLKLAPELDRELVVKSQKYLASKYQDDAPYWGMQKKEVWERYMNWLYENKLIKSTFDAEKAFTNEFLQGE